MKAITVKAPLAWSIFNAKLPEGTLPQTHFAPITPIFSYYEPIDCPIQIAIHAGKSAYSFDVEKFFKDTGIITPAANRLPLGQVIGLVTVEACFDRLSHWDWEISNPTPIKRFDYKGQPGIYEIPDKQINFDCSKNPIIEESGYKSKGNPKGQWWVMVYPHPHIGSHYSFAATIAGGVMSGGIPGDTLLHGCYSDPEEALQAGINELYS